MVYNVFAVRPGKVVTKRLRDFDHRSIWGSREGDPCSRGRPVANNTVAGAESVSALYENLQSSLWGEVPIRDVRPFLKWAGGKQQLLAQYEPLFARSSKRYFEPFVGGGAVFFHLRKTNRLPAEVCLSDNCEELINTYRVVRDQLEQLLEALEMHMAMHSRDHYYSVRGLVKEDADAADVSRAARTIYLNKTCYNGLYRVNSTGQFNVPLGSYEDPRIRDEDALRAANLALQGVALDVRDFRDIVYVAKAGDFVYFDPPYNPTSRTASFTGYTASSFREGDQRDLAGVFEMLSEMGVRCMLSNSYTPLVLDLYKQYVVKEVRASRAISSDPNGRGGIREVVVLNYDPLSESRHD